MKRFFIGRAEGEFNISFRREFIECFIMQIFLDDVNVLRMLESNNTFVIRSFRIRQNFPIDVNNTIQKHSAFPAKYLPVIRLLGDERVGASRCS